MWLEHHDGLMAEGWIHASKVVLQLCAPSKEKCLQADFPMLFISHGHD